MNMTDRSNRNTEYVLIKDSKPKQSSRYYYDADDDNDSQPPTRRVVRTKPSKEQRIRYVTADELESNYRRPRLAESSDRGIKIRNTTNGERVVLDEDNNVIKIIRNSRSPTPPVIDNRRLKLRPRETRTLYYETSDGRLIKRPTIDQVSSRTARHDFVYAEDEPTKVVRKVIIDPRTGDQETLYEKDKPKRQIQQKYVIQKRSNNIPIDSDDDYEQQQQPQPQYVQVVQRRTAPKQELPTTKYMMIRKKVDSEPMYAVQSSVPTTKTNRHIVYETPTKKPSTTYVYATNGKYYK